MALPERQWPLAQPSELHPCESAPHALQQSPSSQQAQPEACSAKPKSMPKPRGSCKIPDENSCAGALHFILSWQAAQRCVAPMGVDRWLGL